jgi:hypothetical protein
VLNISLVYLKKIIIKSQDKHMLAEAIGTYCNFFNWLIDWFLTPTYNISAILWCEQLFFLNKLKKYSTPIRNIPTNSEWMIVASHLFTF